MTARAAVLAPPQNEFTPAQLNAAVRQEIMHPGTSAGFNLARKGQIFNTITDFASEVRDRPGALAGDATLARQLKFLAAELMGHENEMTPPPPRGNANTWATNWTNRFAGAYAPLLDGVIGNEYGHLRKRSKTARSKSKSKSKSKSRNRRSRR